MGNKSDYTAFMAEIIANPDDDSPRLIFADWLEEHGEEARAEFIRVQLELARMDERWGPVSPLAPNHPAVLRAIPLWKRQSLLFRQLKDRGEFLPVDAFLTVTSEPYGSGIGVVGLVRRGFVNSVSCSWEDWTKYADTILAAHPVRRVTLTTWPMLPKGMIWDILKQREGLPPPAQRAIHALRYREVLAESWPGISFKLPEWGNIFPDNVPA